MPTTQKTTVTVRIPTPLRSATDGQATVEIEGDTVDGVLRTLVDQYPDLADNLYNENDALRQFVNIYVGDEDIRFGDGVDTTLEPGDEVSIVPSIAGGRTVLRC
jgi:MoaD family protein